MMMRRLLQPFRADSLFKLGSRAWQHAYNKTGGANMPAKRCFQTFFVLLLLTALLCSCGDVIVEPKWIIGVEGAEKAVFSSLDYAKLSEVTITIEKEPQNVGASEDKWEGVYLKDVVDYLGVKEYTSITLTSSDDISVEYTPDIVNDPLTVLRTSVNGKDLKFEDGYVQAVAGNFPDSMWVKNLSRITVNK
jgi:hypothetical protein